jgi:peptidoglycan/xylan/chitin deacetylase (PgdA/CDA1 family)
MSSSFIKRKALQTIGNIAEIFPLSTLIKRSRKSLFLPFYHLVDDASCPHIEHLYTVKDIRQFENDLDFLLLNFQPISIEDLLEKKQFSKPTFHLTFDDGLKQCKEIIAPILVKKGVPATFFINSAFLDNRELMFRYKVSLLINTLQDKSLLSLKYRDIGLINQLAIEKGIDFQHFLHTYQPYLSTDDIHGLINDGFSIGAHSIDHPEFNQISIQEQKRQIKVSMDEIQERFALNYRVFAFPFTDFGVRRELFECMYQECSIDLSFGGAGLKTDAFKQHFQRFPMERKEKKASELVKTEYLYYLIKGLIGENTINRS